MAVSHQEVVYASFGESGSFMPAWETGCCREGSGSVLCMMQFGWLVSGGGGGGGTGVEA